MTDTNEKLRSLFLTALMVFSVFAGTVAFSGAAAAANDATIDSAVEYTDSGNNRVEIVFNKSVNDVGTITAEVDGETITATEQSQSGQRLVIDLGQNVDPNRNLTIKVEDVDSVGGGTTDLVAEDIDVTTATVNQGGSFGTSDNADIVYRGEPVAILATGQNEDIRVSGGGTNIQASTGTASNVYRLTTENRDTGVSYRVRFGGTTTGEQYFNLTDLNLQVEADDTTITEDDPVEFTATADRSGPALATLLDDGGDPVANQTFDLVGGQDVELEFDESNIDADDSPYSVRITDNGTDTTVTSEDINVSTAGDDEASFGQAVVTEQRGDVAEIPIQLENTDEATLQIGTNDDDNYNLTVTVEDGNDDGEVIVEFNTFSAGAVDDGSTSLEGSVVDVADSDDDILSVDEDGSFSVNDDRPGSASADAADPKDVGSEVLDATDYDLLVVNGDEDNVTEAGEDDVATLSLSERSTESSMVWTTPDDQLSDVRDANVSEFYGYVGDGNVTQSDTIASGDGLIVQVQASGMEGVFAYHAAVNDFNATQTYKVQSGVGPDSPTGVIATAAANNNVFRHYINQTNAGANTDGAEVNINGTDYADLNVTYDEQNDTHFVILDSEALGADDGDEFIANFSASEDNSDLVDDGTESVNDSFAVEDADATLNDDNDIMVQAAAGQNITGTTNVAPSTELTVRIRSEDSESPFLKQPTAIVQPDGTFTATADFSDVSPGANFTAQTRRGTGNLGDEVDGQVGGAATASVSISDQESDGSTVVVDSATLSNGGFIAIHEGSATGDVIGASDYLEAGSHSDIEVTLDTPQDADFTAVAMPHMDTDGDETYDFPDNDGPYTDNGTAVTDSASVTVATDGGETETETEAPDTETETETEAPETETEMETEPPAEETTTGDSGPGFTAAIALIALVAAALLAVRRNN